MVRSVGPVRPGNDPADAVLNALFHPEAASAGRFAVFDAQTRLTLHGLHEQANRIANWIAARGLGRGDVVAIHADRNAQTVAALLGVMKSGAAFTIFDAEYPDERLVAQAKVANPGGLIVTSIRNAAASLTTLVGDGVLDTRDSACWADLRSESPTVDIDPDAPAYIAFTSGTTGGPKAIRATARPLAHFLAWHVQTFGLGATDRFSALSGLGHDPFLRDVLTPLLVGAEIHLPPQELRLEPDALVAWMADNRVTVCHLTPSLGEVLAFAQPRELKDLRFAFFGGEPLRGDRADALRKRAPSARMVSFYGTTETPQAMAFFEVPPQWQGRVPIGKGIEGVDIVVVTEGGRKAAPGEDGEIAVCTRYLADGYVAGARGGFVPNPFATDAAERMYRTGDRGRYLPDGNVAITGRIDDQVKVRGFRVELAEIDEALRERDRVKQAAVLYDEERQALVAYVVSDLTTDAIVAGVRAKLPPYMVPTSIVHVDALPLTPGGKVDRAALRRMGGRDAPAVPRPVSGDADAGMEVDGDEIERPIVQIWGDVLGVDVVELTDNFFDLGGHSLNATQVAARLREAFGVTIAVRTIFEAPTVAELAARVRATLLHNAPPSARGAAPHRAVPSNSSAIDKEPPPLVTTQATSGSVLSYWQDTVLAWERKRQPSTTWLVYMRTTFEGSVDVEALASAVERVLDRQEALRQLLYRDPTVPPRLCAASDVPLAFVDARVMSDADVDLLVRARMSTPFLLDGSPLIRFLLVRRREAVYRLYVTWHQLVHDATSELFIREILEVYGAIVEGRPADLPLLPFRFTDHAAWERDWFASAGASLVEDARARVAGAAPVPLPADRPRVGVPTLESVIARFVLDNAESARFLQTCRAAQGTPFMGAFAFAAVALARWCSIDDVVLVSPVSTRTRDELEHLAGRFGSTVPLRVSLADRPTMRELFARARSSVNSTFALSAVPASLTFTTDDAFAHPLARVILNMPIAVGATDFNAVTVGGTRALTEPIFKSESARSELTLLVVPERGRIHVSVTAATTLFDSATIEAFVAEFASAFRSASVDALDIPVLGRA